MSVVASARVERASPAFQTGATPPQLRDHGEEGGRVEPQGLHPVPISSRTSAHAEIAFQRVGAVGIEPTKPNGSEFTARMESQLAPPP